MAAGSRRNIRGRLICGRLIRGRLIRGRFICGRLILTRFVAGWLVVVIILETCCDRLGSGYLICGICV